ncbi:MAG: efflux RND transporter periplasmic adaptor subunit [Burkholderiaceae bacterium]
MPSSYHFRSLVIAGVALVLASCSQQDARQAPVRAVQLVTVVANAPATTEFTYSGEVKAQTESMLGFRVPGKLKSRLVDLGQRVGKGDELASLDNTDYNLSAASAGAQRDAAVSQFDLAKADLARFTDLASQGFIGQAQLQRYQVSLNMAASQLTSASAGASAQKNQLGYTSLRAPSAGVITGVDADVGQVVSAGVVVIRLAHDGARDVQFVVPQQRLSTVALGQVVQVSSLALGVQASAKVVDVAASADPITRTYVVKVRLSADAQWPLGSSALVQLVSTQASTLAPQHAGASLLPSNAVWLDGAASSVWVLNPETMRVVATAVTVVQVLNDGLLVSGLQAGQEVVSAGAHALTPNQVVKRYTF